MPRRIWILPLAVCCFAPALAHAQPTYKLGVGSHLFPSARLEIKGGKLFRNVVQDDPGFRLQYHFLNKDGKTVQTVEARGAMDLDLPHKEAGIHGVVLEMFYPAYKGGNDQKGMFKAISNFLTYRFEPAAKPGSTPTVQLLVPETALLLHCGKGLGKQQEERLAKGFAYKLLQGTAAEPWPGAAKNYCWQDPKVVRFEITLPAETAGTLRLSCLDGDAKKRKLKITVQGRTFPDLDEFSGPGKQVELQLSPIEVKMGKIEVTIDALTPTETAVVSTIEFIPAFGVK